MFNSSHSAVLFYHCFFVDWIQELNYLCHEYLWCLAPRAEDTEESDQPML